MSVESSLEFNDQAIGSPLDHSQHIDESIVPPVVRVWNVEIGVWGFQVREGGIEAAQHAQFRCCLRPAHDRLNVAIVRRVHDQGQVDLVDPGFVDLPRAMLATVVPVGVEGGRCTWVGGVTDVPIARSRRIDDHQVGQAGSADPLTQDDFGHGGAADVAQADRGDAKGGWHD